MKQTHGDRYNCLCPHCNEMNHYITQGVAISYGGITTFDKQCIHCKNRIFYNAKYNEKDELEVTACTEKESATPAT